MRNFYTKNTVEAPNYFRKCGRETQWRIDGGRPSYCIPCYNAPQKLAEKPPVKVEQPGLFDGDKP
jgi:hypothetical protein